MKITVKSSLISAVILSIYLVAVLLLRDTFIIQFGIRQSRVMFYVSIIVVFLLIALVAVIFIRTGKDKQQDSTVYTPIFDEDSQERLCKRLSSILKEKWNLHTQAAALITQLAQASDYDSNLRKLVDENNLSTMQQESITGQILDSMFTNVQKLINYAQTMSYTDDKFISGKCDECLRKNQFLLNKVSDFAASVVKYINDDFNGRNMEETIEYLDQYRRVVLEDLKIEDTYLN